VIDNGLMFAMALLLSFTEMFIYKKLEPRLAAKHVWIQALLHALHRPLQFLIWGVAASIIFEELPFAETNAFDRYIATLQKICVIATFLWFFLAYINQVELLIHKQIDRKKRQLDKTSVTALCQLSQVMAIVIVGLVLMQNMGVSVSAILAFGGMGGLAAGFAAKDALSNYMGGLMIFLDRPFSVGDHVRSPDQEIEGTVERVGWRLTRIRTLEKRLLFVPNGVFSNVSIENISRMTHRRIKTNFSLTYSNADKADLIQDKILAMLEAHPLIDKEESMSASLQDISTSALNFMVVAHTRSIDSTVYQRLLQEIILNIIAILREVGAECATSSTTLYLAPEINPEKLY
ncbi:MAG TPA: mechanosensitive ion channel family protein, partial [Coxiellaceae bacterium]|nr:mechanosensitive ion channel family protein [Coxiellaceae bacterium]